MGREATIDPDRNANPPQQRPLKRPPERPSHGAGGGWFSALSAGVPASAKVLAGLCDRAAVSLEAGVPVLRVLRGEASRATGRAKGVHQRIATAVESGAPLDEAVADEAPYFPPLFVEMVRVGEHTGRLPETLRRLGHHYEHRVRVARDFRSSVAWPVFQLLVAVGVVGLLIAVGGMLSTDLLGFGLTGARGMPVYLTVLLGGALTAGLGWLALLRRPEWGAAMAARATALPVVGMGLQKIALARIAWALRLLLDVEIDLRRAAPLALRAAGNLRYGRHGEAIARSVERGAPLSEAFEKTGVFPRDFLDHLEVAEESGRIVESMERLSSRYEQEAESATKTLAAVAGGVVWLLVASLIIALIFRLFSVYTAAIGGALKGF